MRFWKYQALGNDYIVIEPTDAAPPSPAFVRAICDRHRGVGSDGVLYGPLPASGGFGLRIFNPDGGEAEKSGNGVRIFARHLRKLGHVTTNSGRISTPGGVIDFCYLDGDRIETDMGTVSFWSDALPMTGPRREVIGETLSLPDADLVVTCLTVGNPHCVVFVANPTPDLARTLGPQIERHPAFPNRINVQFVQVVDRSTIRIEIWERGAGYTLASGTSSCAAASAAHRLGLVDANVQVAMPGGILSASIAPDWQVSLTGEATPVFHGELAPDLARNQS